MSRIAKWCWMAAVLTGAIITTERAHAADRNAETILKEIESVEIPKQDVSRANDRAYFREFMTKRQEALGNRAKLILELYRMAPNHAKTPELMLERWRFLASANQTDDAIREIDDAVAQSKDTGFKVEAVFVKALVTLRSVGSTESPDLSAVEEFAKLAPKDPRLPQLLYRASSMTKNNDAKMALEDRILKEFADSSYTGRIKGNRRCAEGVGKPFDLEFTDAIAGSIVSTKNLKGKVVVIDFWATWCGPCVAEMPTMKKLYANYRGQGVEFIGVSLDQPKEKGGLEKLKVFVKENGIAWPQYYQGNYWQSEFSTSWGIHSIPCVFIVDTDGNLYSTEARGKLEEMIPALLKKKTSAVSAAGAGGE